MQISGLVLCILAKAGRWLRCVPYSKGTKNICESEKKKKTNFENAKDLPRSEAKSSEAKIYINLNIIHEL